jgi:hypothetical protein
MGGIMEPKEMKLPEKEKAEFLSSAFIRKEWIIDPAILKRLRDDVVIDIVRIQAEHLQAVAILEGEMWGKVSEIMKRKG